MIGIFRVIHETGNHFARIFGAIAANPETLAARAILDRAIAAPGGKSRAIAAIAHQRISGLVFQWGTRLRRLIDPATAAKKPAIPKNFVCHTRSLYKKRAPRGLSFNYHGS